MIFQTVPHKKSMSKKMSERGFHLFLGASIFLLTACGAATPDTWYGGSFDAAVHTRKNDAAWALRCESEKSCQMSMEISEPGIPVRKEVFDLVDVPLVKDLTNANAALDYVRSRAKEQAQGQDQAQAQEQQPDKDEDMDARLQPLISSTATIEECTEIDAKRLGYGMLCHLKESPWKAPTVLLVSANIGCCGCNGSYSCRYPIIPLQGTWSNGSKDAKTANSGKWSIFK
jgi:hypothetical protein